MAIRELPFIVDTRVDSELSGVNQRLRQLTNRKRPVEPRHIVGMTATARPNDRTVVLRISYDDSVFFVDASSPENGKTFDRASAPRSLSLVMSNPIDTGLASVGYSATYNGQSIPITYVSVTKDYVFNVDLQGFTGSVQGPSLVPLGITGDGVHSFQLDTLTDVDGNGLTSSEVFSWAVEGETVNIDPGQPVPYTKDLKYGNYRIDRLVVPRGTNVQERLDRFLADRGISRDQILAQDMVTSFSSVTELYVLYLEKDFPRLVKMFPNQGSINTVGAPPDRVVLSFSQSLDSGCMVASGNILFGDVSVDSGDISFAPDMKTVFVDTANLLTGSNDTGVHNLCISSICPTDGRTYPGPPVIVSFGLAAIPTGAGGGGGGADIDPYLPLTGGTVDGHVDILSGADITDGLIVTGNTTLNGDLIVLDGGTTFGVSDPGGVTATGNVTVDGTVITTGVALTGAGGFAVVISADPDVDYPIMYPKEAPGPNQLPLHSAAGQLVWIDNTGAATISAGFDEIDVPVGTNPTAVGQATLTGAVDGPITLSGDQTTNVLTWGFDTGVVQHDDLGGIDPNEHFTIGSVRLDQMSGVDPTITSSPGTMIVYDGTDWTGRAPGAVDEFLVMTGANQPGYRTIVAGDVPGYTTHTGDTGVHFEQGDIAKVGTITGGVWNGTVVDSEWGGTSVNNSGNSFTFTNDLTVDVKVPSSTITTSGDVSFGGPVTITPNSLPGGSSLLAPSVGTIATTTGTQSLINKTLDGTANSFLSIPEASIADGAILARVSENETIDGDWTFEGTNLVITGNSFYVDNDAGMILRDSAGNTVSIAAGNLGGSYVISTPTGEPTASGQAWMWDGAEYRWSNPDSTVDAFKIVSPPDGSDSTAVGEDTLTIQAASGAQVFGGNSNTLVFWIQASEIDHQLLSGAGAEDHAAIDTHLSNLANPHGITLVQVTGAATGADTDSHVANTSNPHSVTLSQIGGATGADVVIGAATGSDFDTHTDDLTNPHQVSLTQITGAATGSDVDATTAVANAVTINFALHEIASNPHSITLDLLGGATGATFDAHAAASNPHDITLSGLGGATGSDVVIGAATGIDVDNHIANVSNPHSVTLGQIGGATGVDTDNHVANTSNPHSVTLSQIGGATGSDVLIGAATGATYDAHAATSSIHFTEASIDHRNIQNIGSNTHVQIDSHIANTSNPHGVTAAQVGAADQTVLTGHTGDLDNPHATTAAHVQALALTGGTITGPLQFDDTLDIDGDLTVNNLVSFNTTPGAGTPGFSVSSYGTPVLKTTFPGNGLTSLSKLGIEGANSFTGVIYNNNNLTANRDYEIPDRTGALVVTGHDEQIAVGTVSNITGTTDILAIPVWDSNAGEASWSPTLQLPETGVALMAPNYYGGTSGYSALYFAISLASTGEGFGLVHHYDSVTAAARKMTFKLGNETGFEFFTSTPAIKSHQEISMQSNKITDLADPTDTGDAVSLSYLDTVMPTQVASAILSLTTVGAENPIMRAPMGGVISKVRAYQNGGTNGHGAEVVVDAVDVVGINGVICTDGSWVESGVSFAFDSGDTISFKRSLDAGTEFDSMTIQIDYQFTGA